MRDMSQSTHDPSIHRLQFHRQPILRIGEENMRCDDDSGDHLSRNASFSSSHPKLRGLFYEQNVSNVTENTIRDALLNFQ